MKRRNRVPSRYLLKKSTRKSTTLSRYYPNSSHIFTYTHSLPKFRTKHYRMVLLGCIFVTKPVITLASLSSNSSQPTAPRKPSKITTSKPNLNKQNQPSVTEIERAIGAGSYRDYDPASISEPAEKKNVFDAVLSNSIGKTEGKTERALRETGEWISGQTEGAARSSGKKILEVMFFWLAPAWFVLLLIATGAVKLPFSFPALDDLIM